jgi:hypothetical protein
MKAAWEGGRRREIPRLSQCDMSSTGTCAASDALRDHIKTATRHTGLGVRTCGRGAARQPGLTMLRLGCCRCTVQGVRVTRRGVRGA